MGTRINVAPAAAFAQVSGGRQILMYTAPSGVQATVRSFGLNFGGTNAAGAKVIVSVAKGVISSAGTASAVTPIVREGLGTALGSAASNYTAPATQTSPTIVYSGQFSPVISVVMPLNVVLAPGEALIITTSGSTENVMPSYEVELG